MRYLLPLIFLVLAACSESEDDKIGQAQLCLDKASPSEAEGCVREIQNINKPAAQGVKCAAGFVSEGFGRGDRYAKALQQIDMYCQGSNFKSYDLLGAIALTATTISAIGKLQWTAENPPTAGQVRNAINTIQEASVGPATIQALQEIGIAVRRIYQNGCYKKVPAAKFYEQVQDAINAVSESSQGGEALAERALQYWKEQQK
jgi:hypothetical protein